MIYGTCNLFSTLLLKVGRCCINYVLLAGKQSGGEIWQLPSAECIFNLSITFAHLHNNKEAINHHEIPQKCIPLRQDVFHFWLEKVVIQEKQ